MRKQTLKRFHILFDTLLVSSAWIGAYWLRYALDTPLGRPLNPLSDYLRTIPVIVIPWIASGWFFGIYRIRRAPTVIDAIQDLLKGALLGFLAISCVGFFFKEYHFGRLVVVFCAGLSLALQSLSRALFARIETRHRHQGGHDVRTLVLGAGTTGIRLVQRLQDHPEIGYRVVGFLDDDPALQTSQVTGYPVLGPLSALRELVQREAIDEVIVAVPTLDPTELLSLVVECASETIRFQLATRAFTVLSDETKRGDTVGDLPLVELCGYRASPLYATIKRAIDLLGASVGMLCTLPFWPYWALRIRRDSPGPVFFCQQRVGSGGRKFKLYKFRTMESASDAYAAAPRIAGDRRITRYGAWLRRSSIDELPNLLNVLRGEMSLVGPRPEMPFIVDTYSPWQRRRLIVKPGITGLWQILGRKDLPMHQNLHYDFYYIQNRTTLLDLAILLRTIAVVFKRKGAY